MVTMDEAGNDDEVERSARGEPSDKKERDSDGAFGV
jgi:hypothetical protein